MATHRIDPAESFPSADGPSGRYGVLPAIRFEGSHDEASGGALSAMDGTREAGYITWRPHYRETDTDDDAPRYQRVAEVSVHPDYRNRGLATELYRRAAGMIGGPLDHSRERTPDGEAFARRVGGYLPPRDAVRWT